MNIAAIIPIRYKDCFKQDGTPKYFLQKDPLWEWTFRDAIKSQVLNRIIIAFDDERFLPYLDKWEGKLEGYLRPKFLSEPGITSLDVLSHVLSHEKDRNTSPDYVMLLEITHPLRPPGIISQLVENTKKQSVDSLVTVYPVHYSYWKKNETGEINRIEGSGDNKKILIYQELIGICSIFRSNFSSSNPFGEQIDMVPIERFWASIDVRNEDGRWLAERYLDKIKKNK